MTATVHYSEFLRDKVTFDRHEGFAVNPGDIHPLLLPHQRDIVQWALAGGRRAVFAAFGLGKSIIQLEICRIATEQAGGSALIVVPLGVRHEFRRDARLVDVDVSFIRSDDERTGDGIYLTNYESVRLGKIDPATFTVVSLDEAAVLRSLSSKQTQALLTAIRDVPYRYLATATPSPNRYLELVNYADWLGVMDRGQALTRFFRRDSTKAGNLTLHPSKADEFWLWLSTWAVFVQRPSDLGYSDDGYDLPAIDVRWHEIPVDHTEHTGYERDGQVRMFRGAELGIGEASREKRATLTARIAKTVELVDEAPDDHFIIWHHLEDERRALKRALPDVVEAYGTLDLDEREQRIIDFSDGHSRLLATKPSISGAGCNFQRHCHRAIYVGVDYDFHLFVQSVHRIQRFQQPHPVRIDIVYAESERDVVRTLRRKWNEHKELTANMAALIQEHGLSRAAIDRALARSIGIERSSAEGEGWLAVNNDCVDESTNHMSDNSVDMILTSIPFCYDEQTEVLTRRGWLTFGQVTLSDSVATVHPRWHCIEWQQPTALVWEPYDGEMIHFTGRSFDHLVTPGHRMFAARRRPAFETADFQMVTADTIAASYEQAERRTATNGRILRGWRTCLVPPRRGDGDRPDTITIPPLPRSIRTGHGVELYWIKPDDFMRLAGWYLSEGHADPFDHGRQGGRLSIAQTSTNQSHRDEIEEMFLRIGLPPSMQTNQISVWCRNLAWFMQQEFGHGAAEKRIPRWVKDLHPDLLEILRDTMMKGDGSKRLDSYASISSQLRDDFQEVCLATGWRAAVTDGKIVNTGSTQLYPEIRSTPNRVQYSGMIGCLTVPNHTLVVRRNGRAFVSGNSNHYEYTPSVNDFGHTDNNDHFWAQMDYLTPQLLRVLKPGRIYACHVKDRILYGNMTGLGAQTSSPFHAEAILHSMRHGFVYLGMITCVTDVVAENNQTYRLTQKEMRKDGTKMGVGSPEYILLFRKQQTDLSSEYADEPVVHPDRRQYSLARWQTDAHGFWRSNGNRHLTPDELAAMPSDVLYGLFRAHSAEQVYDYESHLAIGESLEGRGALPSTFMLLAPASPSPWVWADVDRLHNLNAEQSRRAQQQHICPLPFDLVDRLIERYSNRGDLIFDPFGGLSTVAVRALELGRRGRTVELNAQYWCDAVKYCEATERRVTMPRLFDLDEPA